MQKKGQNGSGVPIYVLGMGLPSTEELPWTCAGVHAFLEKADVLIGGKSQLARFTGFQGQKIVVGADVESLYERMADLRADGKVQAVLCSGDPLFFGLGARLAERFGASAIRVLPGISSMQAAAAFIGHPWESMRPVSLHGRNTMLPLAHALMAHSPIFLLCDKNISPLFLIRWMRERGCSNYAMHILDNLYHAPSGEIQAEKHVFLRLSAIDAEEGAEKELPGAQRVVLLMPEQQPEPRLFGLDDQALSKENSLFTKMPHRSAGLAALGISPACTVWDLGAGSGAVSIEASRLAWQGQVFAVERQKERIALIHANRRRFSAVNMEIVQGEFPACLERERFSLPRPDRIFIGGGLGTNARQAQSFLASAWSRLRPGGRLLVSCVLLASLEQARSILSGLGASVRVSSLQAAESSPLGGDMRLKALNPVFLVLAEKETAKP